MKDLRVPMVAIVALVSGIVLGAVVQDIKDIRGNAIVNVFAEAQDRQFESLHVLSNLSFIEHDLTARLIHYVSGHQPHEFHPMCPVCAGSPRQTLDVPTVSLEPEHRDLKQALIEGEENRTMVHRVTGEASMRISILQRLLANYGDE